MTLEQKTEEEFEDIASLQDLAYELEEVGFAGIDASADVSLLDYGFLYNEETEEAVFFNDSTKQPAFQTTYISEEAVIEALEDIDEGFFSFVDRNKDKTAEEIVNEGYLPVLIDEINAYNGALYPSPLAFWDQTAADIRNKFIRTDRLSSDYIGTVSRATLRNIDLLEAYARLAEELVEEAKLKKTYTGRLSSLAYDASSLFDELTEEEVNKSEEAVFLINEDFFNLFNEIAPKDCHFGSNEGDGADFGFWPNWQELTEEEVEELIS